MNKPFRSWEVSYHYMIGNTGHNAKFNVRGNTARDAFANARAYLAGPNSGMRDRQWTITSVKDRGMVGGR